MELNFKRTWKREQPFCDVTMRVTGGGGGGGGDRGGDRGFGDGSKLPEQ